MLRMCRTCNISSVTVQFLLDALLFCNSSHAVKVLFSFSECHSQSSEISTRTSFGRNSSRDSVS